MPVQPIESDADEEFIIFMAALREVAAFLKSDKCKRVVALCGAGISVSAGIPDFRSPGGMYDTLRPELLTATDIQKQIMEVDPTAVVEANMFSQNQFPYLEVRRPFIIGIAEQKWKATKGHWFLRLLHDQGKLHRIYTQNIDGLDYQTGVPAEKIINVHGTLGEISCEDCRASYPMDCFLTKLKENIKDIYGIDANAPKESTNIACLACAGNGVKPATVLYGSSLPEQFFTGMEEDFPDNVDLLIVIGTSLTVFPANSLVGKVSPECKRLIINREPVGEYFGVNYSETATRDYFLQGDSDESIEKLVAQLDWENELTELMSTN